MNNSSMNNELNLHYVKPSVNPNTSNARSVALPNFYSRRNELLEQQKPVYNYKPKILKSWTKSDFIKQCAALKKSVPQKEQSSNDSSDVAEKPLLKNRKVNILELDVMPLKKHLQSCHRSDRWWIVVDTRVLLDDFNFVQRLVKSDQTCRLRLPYEVLHDLSAMTNKRLPIWMRIPAKRVTKFICTEKNLVIAQGAVEAEDVLNYPQAVDNPINCCLLLMKLYYYVVLITDDPDRRLKATTLEVPLPCYTLDEVRHMATVKSEAHTFLDRKVYVTINNDKLASGDLWSLLHYKP